MGERIPVLPLAALAALGVSVFLPPDHLPALDLCWMKAYLGVPCPACGMTHAFCALGHGRFAEAWALQPFSYLLFPLTVATAADPFFKGRFAQSLRGGAWALALVAGLFAGWAMRWN